MQEDSIHLIDTYTKVVGANLQVVEKCSTLRALHTLLHSCCNGNDVWMLKESKTRQDCCGLKRNTEYKSVEGNLKVQNKNYQKIVVASN